MANGFSPYQVAAPTVNLIGQSGIIKKKKQESNLSTTLGMGNLEEAMTKEMDELGLSARGDERGSKSARKNENILQFASLFTNPIISGIIGGLLGGRKRRRARKARKQLLNLNKKYGKTFLRDKSRAYMSEVESMQLDKGGDFMAGLENALVSGLTSKLLGGKSNIGGGDKFMSKFGTGKGALSNIKFGTGEGAISKIGGPEGPFKNMFKGLKPGEGPFKNVGKAGEGATPFDKFFGRDIGTPMETIAGKVKEGASSWSPYQKPGFFEGANLFGGKGKEGFNYKSLMMLPALLSLFEEKEY